jgi:D-threo-aldose 1-dehydrogenase
MKVIQSRFPLRKIPKSGQQFPMLGFGTVATGGLFQRIPESQAQETLEAAWRNGIRYFDTAPYYGHGQSEHRLGHMLRQKPRDEFLVSTKVGRVLTPFDGKPEDKDYGGQASGLPFDINVTYDIEGVTRAYEDCMTRLGLNSIDSITIHDLDRKYYPNEADFKGYMAQMKKGWPKLEALRAAGKIGAIGAGINEKTCIKDWLDNFDIDYLIIAMPYTLLDQEVLDKEFLEIEKRGVGIVLGAPFASGILATGAIEGARYNYQPASPEILAKVRKIEEVCANNKTPLKAAALQFPLGHPNVVSIIPGPLTETQLYENIEMLKFKIPAQFWAEMKHAKLLHERAPLPTGFDIPDL